MQTHGPLVPHKYCNRPIATHVVNLFVHSKRKQIPAQSWLPAQRKQIGLADTPVPRDENQTGSIS
jgi:hypothetical protein